jgi:F-type H+-transporting ATPase subunit delta
MASPTIRYSDALLAVTREKGNSEAVDADLGILRLLFRARSAGDADAGNEAQELRLFLENPRAPQERKVEAMRKMLSVGGRSPEDTTMRFLALILAKGRQGYLPAIVENFHKKALSDRGEAEGRLTTALALDSVELATLQAALSKELGKKVLLDVEVDSDLIGGFRALIGDSLFDSSLKGQIDQLGRRLKGVPLGKVSGE